MQMLKATEVKITERDDEMKKRLINIKLGRDLERQRIERLQLYNFVKDVIVRGTIFSGVIKHIRKTEGGDKKQFDTLG